MYQQASIFFFSPSKLKSRKLKNQEVEKLIVVRYFTSPLNLEKKKIHPSNKFGEHCE